MATITTDTFLDGGTARTTGEAWTMNGGVLTIRTDTRVLSGDTPGGISLTKTFSYSGAVLSGVSYS